MVVTRKTTYDITDVLPSVDTILRPQIASSELPSGLDSNLTQILKAGALYPAIQQYSHDLVFTASDADTAAWATGTLTLSDGQQFAIAGANTGNMSAKTYIYFDKKTSQIALQTSTTSSDSIGPNKILIAVAEDNASGDATIQVFGGTGGILVAGGSINVSQLSAIVADMGSITAGDIVLPSGGFVRSGQTAFDTGTGFYIANDSGTPKMSIGDSSANKVTWDGSTLTIKGEVVSSIGGEGGDGSDGDVTISSGTTTLTRDMYYDTLTVNSTGILECASYRVFAKTKVVVDNSSGAVIRNNGKSGGAGAAPTAGTAGVVVASGSLPPGKVGVVGATGRTTDGVGANGTDGVDADKSVGSVGVAGGAGGGTTGGGPVAGGPGGTAGAQTGTALSLPQSFPASYNLFDFTSATAVQQYTNSSGSGSGGAGAADTSGGGGPTSGGGGGSGSTGGFLFISTNTLDLTGAGCIQTHGGTGGDGGTGVGDYAGGGGGGGGGAGGILILIYSDKTGTGTTTATGGTGGTGGGSSGGANDGATGPTGTTGKVIEIVV